MDVLRLTLPEPPSLNTMWRKWRNRMVLSAAGRAFKQAVAMKGLAAVYKGYKGSARAVAFPTGDLLVTVYWYRSSKRGDLDNRIKAILDALQGTVYRNDKQVAKIVAERIDGAGRIPRVEVEIERFGGKTP